MQVLTVAYSNKVTVTDWNNELWCFREAVECGERGGGGQGRGTKCITLGLSL